METIEQFHDNFNFPIVYEVNKKQIYFENFICDLFFNFFTKPFISEHSCPNSFDLYKMWIQEYSLKNFFENAHVDIIQFNDLQNAINILAQQKFDYDGINEIETEFQTLNYALNLKDMIELEKEIPDNLNVDEWNKCAFGIKQLNQLLANQQKINERFLILKQELNAEELIKTIEWAADGTAGEKENKRTNSKCKTIVQKFVTECKWYTNSLSEQRATERHNCNAKMKAVLSLQLPFYQLDVDQFKLFKQFIKKNSSHARMMSELIKSYQNYYDKLLKTLTDTVNQLMESFSGNDLIAKDFQQKCNKLMTL